MGKFACRCNDMKGHVWYKIGRMGDAFAKMMAELAINVGANYKYEADIASKCNQSPRDTSIAFSG
jgi:hypothetical protein